MISFDVRTRGVCQLLCRDNRLELDFGQKGELVPVQRNSNVFKTKRRDTYSTCAGGVRWAPASTLRSADDGACVGGRCDVEM